MIFTTDFVVDIPFSRCALYTNYLSKPCRNNLSQFSKLTGARMIFFAIRRLRARIRIISSIIKLSFLSLIPKSFFSRVTFTYLNDYSIDGLGAQMQRQVSICALAHHLGINFIHSPILDIELQPTDNIKSYSDYLYQANSLFDYSSFENPRNFDFQVSYVRLGLAQIVFRSLQSYLSKREMLICVFEIYQLVDANPDIVRRLSPLLLAKIDMEKIESKQCIIHHRQGAGNFTIYPGQSITRELRLENYIQVINRLKLRNDFGGFLTLLTDAPEEDFLYTPLLQSSFDWRKMPTFRNESILIHSQDFESINKIHDLTFEVIRGGNPIESFKLMLKCKVLIISRSSFSYLPALLNVDAEVYFPKNFWHSPLKDWRSF